MAAGRSNCRFCPDDNEIGLHVFRYTKDFVDRITVLNAKQRHAVQLRVGRNQLLELVNECRLSVRPLLHV